MIFLQSNKPKVDMTSVDFCNVNNWNIIYHNIKSLSRSKKNCELINAGLSSAITLNNINGKYTVTSMVYNDGPVFINNNQELMVGGVGYGLGTRINSLSDIEQASVLEDDSDNVFVYRDGPYLLGKFSSDDSWCIIKMPERLFAFDTLVSDTDIDISEFTSEDLADSIVVYQTKQLPPLSLKTNNEQYVVPPLGLVIQSNSRLYNDWLNADNPMSRPWIVDSKYNFYEACDAKQTNMSKPFVSFGENYIFDLENINRQPETITRSQNFETMVYNQFSALKQSFVSTANGLIVPPVLELFAVNWFLGTETNLEDGVSTDLGIYNAKEIVRLKINGKFTNVGDSISIALKSKYVINSIDIYLEDTDETITIDSSGFMGLEPITNEIINNTIQNLSSWVKSTFFMIKPDIFFNDWYDIARSFTINPMQTALIESKYTKKYKFISLLDSLFYDRLYEFMKFKGV